MEVVWRYDTQHNDIRPNDTPHHNTQHNNTQHNGTQYCYAECLLSVIYAECRN